MPELNSKQVLQKLNDGWELRNRGAGWWICEPKEPYQRPSSEPISETVYNQLEADGLIETEMLTTSAVARLKR